MKASVNWAKFEAEYPAGIPSHSLFPIFSTHARNAVAGVGTDVLPLIACMTLLGDIVGGQDKRTWTWSRHTDPCNISISLVRHTSRIRSRRRTPISPVSIAFRYLVHQTKWYFKSYRVYGPVLMSSIITSIIPHYCKTWRVRLKARGLNPIVWKNIRRYCILVAQAGR